MQRHGNKLLYAPSDLGNFIACEHLTQLELAAVLGESERPSFSNAFVDLIKRKGEEHEKNFLEALRAEGHALDEVGLGGDRDFALAAAATAAAMRAGAKYIYQAVFLIDGWHGIADFLERIDRPSALGDWSYQVLDTKLARHPRPEHALQLCFYSHALGTNSESGAGGGLCGSRNARAFPDQNRQCVGLLSSLAGTFSRRDNGTLANHSVSLRPLFDVRLSVDLRGALGA